MSGASSKSSSKSCLPTFMISILMFSPKSVPSTKNFRNARTTLGFWNASLCEILVHLGRHLGVEGGDQFIDQKSVDLDAVAFEAEPVPHQGPKAGFGDRETIVFLAQRRLLDDQIKQSDVPIKNIAFQQLRNGL